MSINIFIPAQLDKLSIATLTRMLMEHRKTLHEIRRTPALAASEASAAIIEAVKSISVELQMRTVHPVSAPREAELVA